MKLILITSQFPAEGGDSTFIEEEWRQLLQDFDEITLISRAKGHKCAIKIPSKVHLCWHNTTAISMVHFWKAPFDKILRQELKDANASCSARTYIKRIKTILQTWAVAQDFQAFFRREKILQDESSLAYTYWMTGATLALVHEKKRHPSLKVVSRVHGADLYNERTPGEWQPFRKLMSSQLDAVYFVSDYGLRYFEGKWPHTTTSIRKVEYLGSISFEQNNSAYLQENTVSMISCSNLIPLKRVDLIVEALALVPETIRVKWRHVGEGFECKRIEMLAHSLLNCKKNVDWKLEGHVPHAALGNYYAKEKITLFITTSQTEGGAPVSIQEAFSAGIPAIGTAVGGIPELIQNGVTGILLDKNPSAEAVAAAIMQYASMSSATKKQMSENAYQKWQALFDARRNAKRFIADLLEMGIASE